MNELPAIAALYSEIATDLDNKFGKARSNADAASLARLAQRKQINDSAYFILAWGQLEAEINRIAEIAMRRRRASLKWDDRRAWDAHDPDDMRARFEDRTALVLDRHNMVSDAYRRTIRYYGWRNRIAHGKNLATGIDVAAIIADFYRIAGALTP